MNKQVNSDSRITDRFIYNEAVSVKNTLLKQEENKNRLYRLSSLFKTLTHVELIDVDTVEACGIKSDCRIKRTKYKLPAILESSGGFVIRTVSSLDGSQVLTYTTDLSFTRKLIVNDQHAKNELFFFVRNQYLYFPNLEWDAVRIEAIFEDPDLVDSLNDCDQVDTCTTAYDKDFPLPNYLDATLKDLLNRSLLQYYHRLKEDTNLNKNPNT